MMFRTIGSYMLLLTGFLACPCHLPLLLPLLLPLVTGTTFGAWLVAHTGFVIGLSTGYFIAALVVGFWLLRRRHAPANIAGDTACCPPMTAPGDATRSEAVRLH